VQFESCHPFGETAWAERSLFSQLLSSHFSRAFRHRLTPASLRKFARQYIIENCARLQRRAIFRSQTFPRYLTIYGPNPTLASARQMEKLLAKFNTLNTLTLTILLSIL
jgi:hypothetical protein